MEKNLQGTTSYDAGYILTLCNSIRALHSPGTTLIIGTPDKMVATMSIIAGGVPVSSYDSLLQSDVKGIPGQCILVECDHPMTLKQKNFVQRNAATFAFRINNKEWVQIKPQ